MRYWNHAPWSRLAQAHAAIAEAQMDYASGASLHCVIEHADTGQLIGSCALYGFAARHRCASIGYLLSRSHWGQGYMSEAVRLLLEYAFEELDLNRVEAEVDCRNTASARALEKLGFRQEGCMRERWIVAGQGCDTQLHGLLRKEWQQHLCSTPQATAWYRT